MLLLLWQARVGRALLQAKLRLLRLHARVLPGRLLLRLLLPLLLLLRRRLHLCPRPKGLLLLLLAVWAGSGTAPRVTTGVSRRPAHAAWLHARVHLLLHLLLLLLWLLHRARAIWPRNGRRLVQRWRPGQRKRRKLHLRWGGMQQCGAGLFCEAF